MNVLHLSAECYPAAKVGGLADVAGALPRSLREEGAGASVLIPGYGTPWLKGRNRETVFSGIASNRYDFRIQRVEADLGFDLFTVDMPGLFEGPEIYGGRGAEAFIAFQRAALRWMAEAEPGFDIVHCHDHQTGLVPFMMTRCPVFDSLASIPTVLTVHNAQYQGRYEWDKVALLPAFPPGESGLLEWGDALNSLAAGLKCCWRITTVSPSYMMELRQHGGGLERLFDRERQKSTGILNGIDTREWDPATDPRIARNYTAEDVNAAKKSNREELCRRFGLPPREHPGPVISYIGRLAREKGADLLPDLVSDFLDRGAEVTFLVLGTGDPALEKRFRGMREWYGGELRRFAAVLEYDERLARQVYAGSDFLIMPSRVEPCGLNQLYSMRYGTIPVVRDTGGLSDTVKDLSGSGGYGITFGPFTLEAGVEALDRALRLYRDTARMKRLRREVMGKDYSWNASARAYINMYNQLLSP